MTNHLQYVFGILVFLLGAKYEESIEVKKSFEILLAPNLLVIPSPLIRENLIFQRFKSKKEAITCQNPKNVPRNSYFGLIGQFYPLIKMM